MHWADFLPEPLAHQQVSMKGEIMNAVLDMVKDHWFWALITLAVLVWYTTITIYVAYKAAHDIKQMLRNLAATNAKRQARK
jgi:hypothetical protein